MHFSIHGGIGQAQRFDKCLKDRKKQRKRIEYAVWRTIENMNKRFLTTPDTLASTPGKATKPSNDMCKPFLQVHLVHHMQIEVIHWPSETVSD